MNSIITYGLVKQRLKTNTDEVPKASKRHYQSELKTWE